LVLKGVAIVFGTIPLLFAALFFIAGGPDPGAGSGVPLVFRLIGLPFLLAGLFLALPNKILVNYSNILAAIPIISGVLLIFALILIATNDIHYLSTTIPFVIFGLGASSSTLSLAYYKKLNPTNGKPKCQQNNKWVV